VTRELDRLRKEYAAFAMDVIDIAHDCGADAPAVRDDEVRKLLHFDGVARGDCQRCGAWAPLNDGHCAWSCSTPFDVAFSHRKQQLERVRKEYATFAIEASELERAGREPPGVLDDAVGALMRFFRYPIAECRRCEARAPLHDGRCAWGCSAPLD
jgi:hypothetical protein